MYHSPLCITPATITDKNFYSKKEKNRNSKYTKNLPESQEPTGRFRIKNDINSD